MIKKGLSPRLAEIGKIKIGGHGEKRKSKKGADYRLPVRYENFLVTTTEKDKETDNFIIDKEIMKKIGASAKELSIRLPFDDIDMNFFTSFQLYKGKKRRCQGDGEKAEWTNDDGTSKQITCDPDKCKHLEAGDCKVGGILSCMLTCSPEIGGVYRFRTHSWNTVSNILSALKFFSENTNGVLQGLPFKLKMLKKSTQEHGNVTTVTIVLDGIEMLKMREMALLEFDNRVKLGIDMKMIERQAKDAGFDIDRDDPENIESEFYCTEETDTELPEEKKPGVTSEQATDKLKDKEKAETLPDKPVGDDHQGSLL